MHALLLEEDHYVFQDSIHIIRQLTEKYFLIKLKNRNNFILTTILGF